MQGLEMIWGHPFRILAQDIDGQVRSCESDLRLESARGIMSLSETVVQYLLNSSSCYFSEWPAVPVTYLDS